MEPEKTQVVYNEKTEIRHTVTTKVDEVVGLAQDEAQARYSPWTGSMWRLYGCLWIAYLCGCLNGYDGSLMGGVNAMDSYQQFFKLGQASSGTGLVFAMVWGTRHRR